MRSRDDAAVLYAWCRRADDAVDTGAISDPAAVLGRLADELDAAYAGVAQEPLLAAFGAVARARGIPHAYPRELLAGMAMDLADTRYATVDDLIGYAYRVAGVVGLMMTHVLGVDDEAAVVPAVHLGIAMQVTNVCRDVADDWQRGRLYIPCTSHRADPVEMCSHVGIFIGHGTMMLGWWRCYQLGYPGVERTLAALGGS